MRYSRQIRIVTLALLGLIPLPATAGPWGGSAVVDWPLDRADFWTPELLARDPVLPDSIWQANEETLPRVLPADCETLAVGGQRYFRCGMRWYQKVFHDTDSAYFPVGDPR